MKMCWKADDQIQWWPGEFRYRTLCRSMIYGKYLSYKGLWICYVSTIRRYRDANTNWLWSLFKPSFWRLYTVSPWKRSGFSLWSSLYWPRTLMQNVQRKILLSQRNRRKTVIAIIIASGVGKHMGQDIPKQFIIVEGKPIVTCTLESFQRHP